MSNELLKEAVARLKEAVPLMLKHQIPTTPTNYALWYAYVGQNSPELNRQLDKVVSQYHTCPPSQSEQLYHAYLSDPITLDVIELRQNMDAMVTELSQSVKDTHLDAYQFKDRIDCNVERLHHLENNNASIGEVLSLIKSLASDASDIKTSTQHFTEQLARAQSEINQLKIQLKKSEHDMHFDALTGALNRRAFNKDIKGLVQQNPQGLCLIISDIDHFKRFNDTYGHQLGDLVLKTVAKRLSQHSYEGTKLYRFGGEEFALIVPQSQLNTAIKLADIMRRSLEKLILKDKRKLQRIDNISASFGVAQYQENDCDATLIERADTQLYAAKKQGRNRVMPMI